MNDIIIYGIGKNFEHYKCLIDWNQVVGIIDKQHAGQEIIVTSQIKYIVDFPDKIPNYTYKFIMIFSDIYYGEIVKELHYLHDVPKEKIVSWRVLLPASMDYLNRKTYVEFLVDFITYKYIKSVLVCGNAEMLELLMMECVGSVDIVIGYYNKDADIFPFVEKCCIEEQKMRRDKTYDLVIGDEDCDEYCDNELIDNYSAKYFLKCSPYGPNCLMRKDELFYLIPSGRVKCVFGDKAEIDARIFVVIHKDFNTIRGDLYAPLCVGEFYKSEWLLEKKGKNISALNPYINECTALYWIWKNTKEEYYGLIHYRRFFLCDRLKNVDNVLNKNRLAEIFSNGIDIIVPEITVLTYSIYDNVIKSVGKSVCDNAYKVLLKTLEEKQPDYVDTWEQVLDGNWIFAKNMFVGKRVVMDQYCDWLFSFLTEAVERFDYTGLSGNEKRVMGYFAETMLTCWIMKHEFRIYQLPVVEIV